jgi:signal transduction histidine kinase/ligand-binding sensor domain-containing protein/DNA-binding response OmpR family regulator
MKLRFLIIFLSTFNWFAIQAIGQLRFHRIGTQQGLSQSTVNKIFQDKKGFLWFATRDGLNKYDGYQFTVYRHIFNDPNSISNSAISCITEDVEGNLWVGTYNGGINKLDKNTGKFIHFKLSDDQKNIESLSISAIVATPDNKIWASTYGYGLLCFDNNKKTIRWRLVETELLTTNDIALCYRDRKGNLWIGGHYGTITRIDKNDKAHSFRLKNNLLPKKNQINCFYEDLKGNLLIGTRGNGLFRYEEKTGQFIQLLYEPNQSDRLNLIVAMAYDKQGVLWVATDNGMVLINHEDYQHPIIIPSNPDAENAISSHAIQSLFIDKDDNTWIGAWEAGLNVYYHRRNNLQLYKHKVNSTQHLLRDKVTAISCESNDKIWIGSNNGLTLMDRKNNVFKHYLNSSVSSSSRDNNDVNFLLNDDDGDLLLLTWEVGLKILKKGSTTFVPYLYSKEKYFYHLTCIAKSSIPDSYWIGTQEEGILLFNKKTGIFKPLAEVNKKGLLLSMHINAVLEDKQGILWIATFNNGIFCYNRKTHKIAHYKQANATGIYKATQISKVFQDSQQRIWVATHGAGLWLFQPSTNNFKVWTTQDGLPNNTIKGILEDNHRNLWLSTNNGLSQFIVFSNTFRNYTKSDGLQGSEFLINAYAQNSKGEMFFGGTEGLNVFHPDSLVESNEVPPVYITGIKLFNKAVFANQQDSPLAKDILQTQEISLNADQNVLAIDYTALDFQQLKNNQYAYMLQGFDNDWNFVGNKRTASYTNLNAGEYLFRVKATNNDGIWNHQEAILKVIILPPWYKTWWAFMIYSVLIFLSVYALRKVIQVREHFKSDLKLQEREKQQIQELDRLKTNFFTNISHEFRTPLTLIISPLEKYLSDNKEHLGIQRTRVESIYRNAKQLQKLINQLLDLSKLEAGKLSPEIAQADMVEFIEKITDSFKSLAEHKAIDFQFKSSIDYLPAYFDADILEKVVTNLLSNAFKFSHERDVITVKLSVNPADAQKVIIEVSDTGVGIAAEHLSNIFNRFYQVHDIRQSQVIGSGIGLALCKELVELHRGEILVSSKVGKGSVFTVYLPIAHTAFDNNWIVENTHYPQAVVKDNVLEKPIKTPAETLSEDAPVLLIAEDNEDLRAYIKEIFTDKYKILEASNGQEALMKAQVALPDFIISDWMMPEMTGVQLCEKIKTNQATSHIPVIILTSKSSNDSKLVGLETGADDYITKPFNASLLEARVKNLLENRRKLRERFSQATELLPKEITLNSTDEHFLAQAIRVVEQHIHNPELDIQYLEHELKMSNMQLYRKLKSLTNLSGNEFIKNIRLKKAVQLLETDKYSIAEVAFQVGFNDPSYFTRMFKKEYGKAPSEFIHKKTINP